MGAFPLVCLVYLVIVDLAEIEKVMIAFFS
jgi:hypothetical protein